MSKYCCYQQSRNDICCPKAVPWSLLKQYKQHQISHFSIEIYLLFKCWQLGVSSKVVISSPNRRFRRCLDGMVGVRGATQETAIYNSSIAAFQDYTCIASRTGFQHQSTIFQYKLQERDPFPHLPTKRYAPNDADLTNGPFGNSFFFIPVLIFHGV